MRKFRATSKLSMLVVLLLSSCSSHTEASYQQRPLDGITLSKKRQSDDRTLLQQTQGANTAFGEDAGIPSPPAGGPPTVPRAQAQHLPSPPISEIAPEFSDEYVEPGAVTVIFRDSFKIRHDHANRGVRSLAGRDVGRLNGVLNAHGCKSIDDLDGGIDEVKAAEWADHASAYWHYDLPNLKSQLNFKFPTQAEARAALAEFRGMQEVRIAYCPARPYAPWTRIKQTTPTQPDMYHSPPTDTGFQNPEYSLNPGQIHWAAFNRQRIFHGWDRIPSAISISNIKIAVIDDGFDIDAPVSMDPPHYLGGYNYVNGLLADNNPRPSANKSNSHGTGSAYVIAGPSSNQALNPNSAGVCGILPGASIVPMKHDFGLNSINAAMNKIQNDNLAPTVYVAVSTGDGRPYTVNTTFASWVSTLTSYGKIVVLPAGNNMTNCDESQIPDAGAIIVGATQEDGYNWRDTTISEGSGNSGSSYGTAVHLAACTGMSAPDVDTRFTPYNRPWRRFSGTSGSAPQVAAAAAVAREVALHA